MATRTWLGDEKVSPVCVRPLTSLKDLYANRDERLSALECENLVSRIDTESVGADTTLPVCLLPLLAIP